MTFEEIRKCRQLGTELHFRCPAIKGTLIFNDYGGLKFISDDGEEMIGAPLCYSDFDRDDWFLAPISED